VYGREYGDTVLSFEASGALKDATLVMRDRETDSWWSIMTGDAIGGDLKGQKLVELGFGEKTQWGLWKEKHPHTLVLSVDGVEHDPVNPYVRYFESDDTFRDIEVKDERLPGKEPIYAFRHRGVAYAAPHAAIEGGVAFDIGGGTSVFVYRSKDAHLFESSVAFSSASGPATGKPRFRLEDDGWVFGGWRFEPREGFVGGNEPSIRPSPLTGFDTFWYSWSNVNNDVIILE
jgi:hypothetical protein